VNFGNSVSDSFELQSDSIVAAARISIWDASELDEPTTVHYRITTEPFGGQVIQQGTTQLTFWDYWCCSYDHFWIWEMVVPIRPELHLPSGNYWLELSQMQTVFHTWTFWGESDGKSNAYDIGSGKEPINRVTIGSESFQIIGRQQH
jgi:hypothetical protein